MTGPDDTTGLDLYGTPLGPLALPCHRCGPGSRVDRTGGYWGHGIHCLDCYDGADDASNRGEYVDEPTTARSVLAWNEMQDVAAAEAGD